MPATVQLEFFGGRWNLKKYFGHFFLNFKTHSQQHVDVQVIFEKCYPNSTWPPEVNSKIFCGRKNFKTERLKLFEFYNHTPHNMEMCSWFFQGFTEIQNSRHGSISIFLRLQKLINLGRILLNFYYHIPRDMEMCMWFFKVLPKFKMAAMYDSLNKWVIIHLV